MQEVGTLSGPLWVQRPVAARTGAVLTTRRGLAQQRTIAIKVIIPGSRYQKQEDGGNPCCGKEGSWQGLGQVLRVESSGRHRTRVPFPTVRGSSVEIHKLVQGTARNMVMELLLFESRAWCAGGVRGAVALNRPARAILARGICGPAR
jgi:hypothetical protein